MDVIDSNDKVDGLIGYDLPKTTELVLHFKAFLFLNLKQVSINIAKYNKLVI